MISQRKKQVILIVFTLLVGLIYSIPNIVLTISTPKNRIYLPFSFAETFYAAQAKEILEGHLTIGDPQFIEHKNILPSAFPYLPPLVLASLGAISGNLTNAFYLSDFLFPAVLFLLLTLFAFHLTHHFGYSLVTGLLVIFGYPISTKIPPFTFERLRALQDFLWLQKITAPLPFYRTPNTQFTYIIFLIGLIMLYRLWIKPTRRQWIMTLAAGIALFTTYFYHAVYFVFAVWCLFALALLKKNSPLIKPLFWTSIGLGITILFYQYLNLGEQYQTLKITGGVFFARYIDWISLVRYSSVWGLLVILRKRMPSSYFSFATALLGAAIASTNFQLLTGWTVQPGHWTQTTIEPLVVFMLLVSFYPWWKKWWRTRLTSAFLILLVVYGVLYQIRFIGGNPRVWTIPKDLFNVYEWLNEHGKTIEVATSLDLEVNSYIHVLTPVNIFTSVGQYHYATLPELWERTLYNYKLYHLPQDSVGKLQMKTHASFEYTYNANKYNHYPLGEYTDIVQKQIQACEPLTCANFFVMPSSVVDSMNRKYSELDIRSNPYRLNYAFYTPYERNAGAAVPPGKIVYRSGAYALYQIAIIQK